jgi:hypothetical protein
MCLVASASGCARPIEESATPSPGAPMTHPRGVAIDPVLPAVRPASAANANEGVVVLSEPRDTRPALRIVKTFFDAVTQESVEGLAALFERNAQTRTGAGGRPEPALAAFRRRFDRIDYTVLSSEILYHPSEIELRTGGEESAAARSLPVAPHANEVAARVPLVFPNAAKFFGPELVFLLRPSPGGYKIAELFEDFRLP